jgi:hypothetical protein
MRISGHSGSVTARAGICHRDIAAKRSREYCATCIPRMPHRTAVMCCRDSCFAQTLKICRRNAVSLRCGINPHGLKKSRRPVTAERLRNIRPSPFCPSAKRAALRCPTYASAHLVRVGPVISETGPSGSVRRDRDNALRPGSTNSTRGELSSDPLRFEAARGAPH